MMHLVLNLIFLESQLNMSAASDTFKESLMILMMTCRHALCYQQGAPNLHLCQECALKSCALAITPIGNEGEQTVVEIVAVIVMMNWDERHTLITHTGLCRLDWHVPEIFPGVIFVYWVFLNTWSKFINLLNFVSDKSDRKKKHADLFKESYAYVKKSCFFLNFVWISFIFFHCCCHVKSCYNGALYHTYLKSVL